MYYFSFSPFCRKFWGWNTVDVIWNLLKLQKIKGKPRFSLWISMIGSFSKEIHKLWLIFIFQDKSGHFCLIRWEMTMILGNSVSWSIFRTSSREVYLIFIQNYVEAKRFEPVLRNFAWTNGRLYAFRQIQSEFPKIYTLDAI